VGTILAAVEGGEETAYRTFTRVFKNEEREQRGTAFVYSVLRHSFPDEAAIKRAALEIWPARPGRGRNHSTAMIHEGHLVLVYEARSYGWEKIVAHLEADGCVPPHDGHDQAGRSLRKWLSSRRKAVRKFDAEIRHAGGTPPSWLTPDRGARGRR
jgi:hypothetical protein